VFLSGWYRGIVYTVMSIDILGIAYSVFQLGQTVREGKFQLNLRAVIFFTALVGFTLYTASIPIRMATYANRVMENISTYLISIAFHLLLYLWSIFLMQVQRSKAIIAFRGLIALGATVATLAFVTSMVLSNMQITDASGRLGDIIGYLLPVTQTVIGITFLYYAANFFVRRKEAGKISKDTVSALTRLAQVAVIAFVGYFAVALTNLNSILQANNNPSGLVALTLIRLSSASVRALAILTVMGIRQHERKATHGSATSFQSRSSVSSSVSRARAGSTSTLVAPTATLEGKGGKSMELGVSRGKKY